VTIFAPSPIPGDENPQPMNGRINEHMKHYTDLGWEVVSTDIHWPTTVDTYSASPLSPSVAPPLPTFFIWWRKPESAASPAS
jgi:hypothetical protein